MTENNQTILEGEVMESISLKELSEIYTPTTINHRVEQMERIRNLFVDFKKDPSDQHSNLLIQGFSGSGKTTVVSHLLKENQGDYVWASGADNSTAFTLFKSVCDVSSSTLGHALAKAKEKFREHPRIIVVDEINKLKDQHEVKVFFNALNSLYRETLCPLIVITNKRGTMGLMPDDAYLTFHIERIDFKPYNAKEIKDIIQSRVGIISERHQKLIVNSIDLEALAAYVAKEFDGSIRSALNLTRKCIKQKDFSIEFVKSACDFISSALPQPPTAGRPFPIAKSPLR